MNQAAPVVVVAVVVADVFKFRFADTVVAAALKVVAAALNVVAAALNAVAAAEPLAASFVLKLLSLLWRLLQPNQEV